MFVLARTMAAALAALDWAQLQGYVQPALLVLGLVAIAASSILYSWIWYQPRAYIQYCVDTGTDPCDVRAPSRARGSS